MTRGDCVAGPPLVAMPKPIRVTTVPAAVCAADQLGYPVRVTPSLTLRGHGQKTLHTPQDLIDRIEVLLEMSPINEVAIVPAR